MTHEDFAEGSRMTMKSRRWAALAMALLAGATSGFAARAAKASARFEISFPQAVQGSPLSGRVYVMISRTNEPEVRLQVGIAGPQIFGVDARALKPGEPIAIGGGVGGHPYDSLRDLPKGVYFVQACA
jgi:hypothetical protein